VVRAFVGDALPSLPRTLAITLLATVSLLAYFHLHTKAFRPRSPRRGWQACRRASVPHFLFTA